MKKLFSLLLTITFVFAISNISFATDSAGKIKEIIPKILNPIAYVGYAVSIGMLLYLGAKYTMAAANEKADVKQGSVNYLIGVIVIVSASAIANGVSAIAVGGSDGDLASSIVDAAKQAANGGQ